MARLTKRKLLSMLSFLVSLVVTWVTGASSFARESGDVSLQDASNSLEQARLKLRIAASSRLPSDASLEALGITGDLTDTATGRIVVAAYESDSPSTQSPGNKPVPGFGFVPKQGGDFVPTEENERQTLERLMNARVKIQQESAGCESQVSKGADPFKCYADVLEEFGKSLQQEASRGSHVARAALPIVEQMASEVRAARTEAQAVAAVQRGLGKVQSIRAVRSQDIVIANRQRQQRAVVTDTLQSVEVSLVKAMSL